MRAGEMPRAARYSWSPRHGCAEREIVFARAALVGMTFDRERIAIVLLQPAGLLVERRLSGGRELDRVGFEEDAIADIDDEILRAARSGIFAGAGKTAILGRVLGAGGNGEDRHQRTSEPQRPPLRRKCHPGTPLPPRPAPVVGPDWLSEGLINLDRRFRRSVAFELLPRWLTAP